MLMFLISACTVPVNYYFKNDAKVAVTLMLHKRNNYFDTQSDSFLYEIQTNKEIKFDSYKSYRKYIISKLKNNYSEILVPPKSIIFIGKGSNMKNLIYDSMIVSTNYFKDVATFDRMDKFILQKKNAPKYFAIYEFNK